MTLSPCPKCGHPEIGSSWHIANRNWGVWCKDCHIMLFAPTRELAEAMWNTRVSGDPVANAEIERLKSLIRRVEWQFDGNYALRVCKYCGSNKERGHLPHCPLHMWWDRDKAPKLF